MNSRLKAAMLSGLVFPGVGQFVLKRYRRGSALVLGTLIGLAIMAGQMVEQTVALLSDVSGNGDPEHAVDAVMKAVAALDNSAFIGSGSLLAACWIAGIVDAFVGGTPEAGTEPVE